MVAPALVLTSNQWNDIAGVLNVAFASAPAAGDLLVVACRNDGLVSEVTLPPGFVRARGITPYECNKDPLVLAAKRLESGDITAGGILGFQVCPGFSTMNYLCAATFRGPVLSATPTDTEATNCVAHLVPGPFTDSLAPDAAGADSLGVIAFAVRNFSGAGPTWTGTNGLAIPVTYLGNFGNKIALGYRAASAAGPLTLSASEANTNDAWSGFIAATYPALGGGFAGEPGGGVW